ncbi:hypothetical protein [Corynebacterium jeddahense]|uniref:hypothetical protein n=1 Tax=Corynebacterium jeddahense TaxID=1414719 RepID=UPI002FC29CBC
MDTPAITGTTLTRPMQDPVVTSTQDPVVTSTQDTVVTSTQDTVVTLPSSADSSGSCWF